MTARKKAVTDEQIGQFARKTRELQERVEKGVVPFELTMEGLQLLSDGKFIFNLDDPAEQYRGIQGLTIIGPLEIEKLFLGPNNENPLGLEPGWCPRIPIPLSVKEVRQRVKLAKRWKTKATLFLDIPEVAGELTSLVNQLYWFGIPHKNIGSGSVRQNIFWASWFIKDQPEWSLKPSVQKPVWKIKYELPNWTRNLNWKDQQKATIDHGLVIASAASDTFYLNLVLALTGNRLRRTSYARTSTIFGRSTLAVNSSDEGVDLNRYKSPGDVIPFLGAAVEEVLA